MKKGQKVRVLANNRVGTIIDSHVINHGGRRYVAYQVRFLKDKGEAPWFPAEKLSADLIERVSVVITGEKGSLYFTFSVNHDKRTSKLELTGSPENLKEHHGTHSILASAFISGLKLIHAQPSQMTVVESHGVL